MNKFIKIDKKNELRNKSGRYLNKEDNNNIDIGENKNREREVVSDENKSNSQTHDNDEKYIKRLNELALLFIKK